MEPLRKAARKDDRGFLVFEDNDLAARVVREPHRVRRCRTSCEDSPDSVLFVGVPPALLREVEAMTRVLDYAQGDEILRQGEDADGRVFFIESGHVSIVVPLPNGAHQRVASLGPGMEFGEMALLGQIDAQRLGVRGYGSAMPRARPGSWTRLAEARPALHIAVLENLAKELRPKLRGANQWIAALA